MKTLTKTKEHHAESIPAYTEEKAQARANAIEEFQYAMLERDNRLKAAALRYQDQMINLLDASDSKNRSAVVECCINDLSRSLATIEAQFAKTLTGIASGLTLAYHVTEQRYTTRLDIVAAS